MSIKGLVEQFSALEDPRIIGRVDHRLIDILVIAVCAVIACAESWDDIALYGRSKEESSRAGEFHPHALSEPYVSLSTHTAPSIRPFG
jgi:hypothetical protein